MKKPDLSLFDNADKQTVERLAADYRALDGREQDTLCGRLRARHVVIGAGFWAAIMARSVSVHTISAAELRSCVTVRHR